MERKYSTCDAIPIKWPKFTVFTVLWIRIYWPPGYGSVSQDYGSTDPDPKEISTDPQHWFCQRTMLISALYQIFLPGSHCWPGRGRGTASAGSDPHPPVRPRPPDLSLPSQRGQKVHTHVKNLPSESKHSELDNNHSQKGNVTKCTFFSHNEGSWEVGCWMWWT
jgi:hypothetical protein